MTEMNATTGAAVYPEGTLVGQPVPTQEERTWAMLAHLSVLINLFTGFLGPVAALIIYLVYRDRSRYVSYHALQSLVLQVIVWVVGVILIASVWVAVAMLSIILIGLCLIPIAILISAVPLAAPIYGIVAAAQVNEGRDFKYYLIGDWVRGTLEGPAS